MSFFITNSSKAVYNYAEKLKRQINCNEKLIQNPISSTIVELKKTKKYSFSQNKYHETPQKSTETSPEPRISENTLNYKPFLKNTNRFFWAMSYEMPKIATNQKLKKMKRKTPLNSIPNENFSNYSQFPKRPATKNSSRSSQRSKAKLTNSINNEFIATRPGTSSTNLRENLNFHNEIDLFDYHSKKIVEPTNFVDNENCFHSMSSLRKKEAILNEKLNENKVYKNFYRMIPDFSRKEPKKYHSIQFEKKTIAEMNLEKAIYEQNFVKARKIMGKTLENFKSFL